MTQPYSQLSRYQVVHGNPPLMPNKCLCGKFMGTFVDTGLNEEFYGQIYVCIDCFREIGEQLGLVSTEAYENTNAALEAAREEITRLKTVNEGLKNAVRDLSSVFGEPTSVSDHVLVTEVEPELVTVITETVVEPEPEPDGQVDESGSTDLFGDDGTQELRDLGLDI